MKKLILSVAILAVAASCSKTEVTEIAPSLQNEIGFSTLNDRVVSKAANDDEDDFRLFAHKENTTASAWFIDDYVVSTATIASIPVAPYGGPYYWPADNDGNDAEDDITFYAYAPYNAGATDTNNVDETEATVDGETATITLTYEVPANADEDFTVATPLTAKYYSTGAIYNSTGEAGGTSYETNVPLVFSHMLSKVTFDVKLDATTMKNYYISEDEDEDPEYSGTDETTFNENDKAATIDFTVASNQIVVNAASSTPSVTSCATTVTGDGATTSTYSGALSYMIAPQDVAGSTIQIKGISIRIANTDESIFGTNSSSNLAIITLAGEGDDVKTIDVDDNDIESDAVLTTTTDTGKYAFLPGYHYTFTITIYNGAKEDDDDPILGAEILISATDADWIEAEGISIDQGKITD